MINSILARSNAAKAKFTAAKSRGFKEALRSPAGAIDLASIMVGVLVIGIIGGVIAVAVFAVIPWAQDEAAKGALESVKTAQSVAFTANTADGDATYSTLAKLEAGSGDATGNVVGQSALLQDSDNVKIELAGSGKGYIAAVESDSGNVFIILSDKPSTVLEVKTTADPKTTAAVAAFTAKFPDATVPTFADAE